MKQFTFTIDEAFHQVIRECALIPRPGQRGSWILEEVVEAYEVMHGMGYAHSIETYENGELVGGLYGVAVGGVFCGESMFSKKSDASKAAFAVLVAHLRAWGFHFIDAQVPTDHLKSLGAHEISRDEFLKRLVQYRDDDVVTTWAYDPALVERL